MRRPRNDGPKVWHNPELDTYALRRAPAASEGNGRQEARVDREHRAALEALFAPRPAVSVENGRGASESTRPPKPSRIVGAPPPPSDPQVIERQRLLSRLLVAEGRPGVTRAATDFLRAGFAFPHEQDVLLKLLEHSSEDQVRLAIEALITLLAAEPPKRRAVLESRLRRIEEFADEPATRAAAEKLRRQVTGRA